MTRQSVALQWLLTMHRTRHVIYAPVPRDRCELRIATALALVGGRGQPLREG